jgi:cytochrome c553
MKALSASIPTLAFAALISCSSVTFAAEPPAGASSCSGCHAANTAVETPVPKINGRSADEIMTAMAAFRSGSKPATVMNRIAKGYTDDELKPIAAWLAAQK